MKPILVAVTIAVILTISTIANAANRLGSHRVGGHGPHGKGSQYVGGYSTGGPLFQELVHNYSFSRPATAAAPANEAAARGTQENQPAATSAWTRMKDAVSAAWQWVRGGEPSNTRQERSWQARAVFQSAFACPANGATRGPCPGFVVDHIVPLCLGGADTPSNMQWQASALALAKDVQERAACRTR